MEQPAAPVSLKRRYTQLESDREHFLRRARDASSLSIPSLIPPMGHSPAAALPTPFQSMGARGVNNLAAKLLLALFPPNAPFFKFTVDPYALALALPSAGDDAGKAQKEIEQSLLKAEEAVQGEIEARLFRPYLHEALKHLVVAGNALLYVGEGGDKYRPRVYHLPNYVVRRCNDNVEEIVTRESVDKDDLPPEIAAKAAATDQENGRADPTPIDLFTGCRKNEDGSWRCWQEAADMVVAGSEVTYREGSFPYIVLRGEVVSGEHYGRGIVEHYQGDLQSLEGLSQAIVEGAAAAAAGRFMVNPNGLTDERDVANKPNWSFVPGRADDITVLQLDKYADFQVAGNTAREIKEQLSFAFLLNTAVQRNAERVTAEEVRFMAQELEQGLGGLYSLLSGEFQLPFVTVLVERMKRERRFPKLPKRVIRPTVVTGLEALGRGNDLSRLSQAFAVCTQALGPEATAAAVRPGATILRVMTAAGVRADDLIKSDEELQQEAQQAQMAALAQRVGPNVVNQMGNAMASAQTQQPSQETP